MKETNLLKILFIENVDRFNPLFELTTEIEHFKCQLNDEIITSRGTGKIISIIKTKGSINLFTKQCHFEYDIRCVLISKD